MVLRKLAIKGRFLLESAGLPVYRLAQLRSDRGRDLPTVTLSVSGSQPQCPPGPVQDSSTARMPPPPTHQHTHTHTFWRSAPQSRTPPTHTMIGSRVPVSCYVSEQVLAICTVNQALKTMDFRGVDDDTAELAAHISVEAQASHRLHQSIPPPPCPGRTSACLLLCCRPPAGPECRRSASSLPRESVAALGCFTLCVAIVLFAASSLPFP